MKLGYEHKAFYFTKNSNYDNKDHLL